MIIKSVLLLIVSTLLAGESTTTPPSRPHSPGSFVFDLVDRAGASTTNGTGLLIAYNRDHPAVLGTVCDDSFSHTAATVICKEMGYQCAATWSNGARYSIQASYPIILDNIICGGQDGGFTEECSFITEHNCGHAEDVFLTCDRLCAYQFFLVDRKGQPTNNNSGLLIANKVGTDLNGTVCDDSFTGAAATVICRSMNRSCAASWNNSPQPWAIQGTLYDILLDDVVCEDPAANFSHCNYRTTNNCGHTEDIHLTCECIADRFEFHLLDESGARSGTGSGLLVAKKKDSKEDDYGTVCDDNFNTESAGVICKMMGFQYVNFWIQNNVRWAIQDTFPIMLDNLVCTEDTDCTYSTVHNCGHAEDVFLSCSNTNERSSFTFHTVDRNNNRTNNGSGLLIASRANFESATGTVCDDQFNSLAATLICKQMGFNCSMSWSYGLNYPAIQDSYSIILDDVRCGPGNKTFGDCLYSVEENCGHGEDVFMSCAGDCTTSFSLVDRNGEPTTNGSGLLLASQASSTKKGTVCDDNFSDTSATVICKAMGFACSAYWTSALSFQGQNDYDILLDNVRCLDANSPFEYCNYDSGHNCAHAEDIHLWCAQDCVGETVTFSLVDIGGKATDSGRGLLVAQRKINEVYQVNGTVCDDEFTDHTADVICTEMGWNCSYTRDNGNNYPHIQSALPIVLDNVVCPAEAVGFGNCSYDSSHNCGHTEDIFLICSNDCSGPADLHITFSLLDDTGSPSRDGKGLLVATTPLHRGTVCDDSFSDFAAAAICKKMGHPCASDWTHSLSWGTVQNSLDIALDNVVCTNDNFSNCTYDTTHNCGHGEDIFLTCEDRCLSGDLQASLINRNGEVSDTGEGLLVLSSKRDDVAGTVCGMGFTALSGNAICQTMGYSCFISWDNTAIQIPGHNDTAWLIQSTYEVLASNVMCTPGNSNFSDHCSYTLSHNCTHSDDVFLKCGGIRNIARAGLATQVNTGYGGYPSRALDGITDGNYFSGNRSVTHTVSGGTEAWWKLTWDRPYYIDTIRIWNRQDCCKERLNGATIHINGTVVGTVTHSFTEDVYTFEGLHVTASEILIRGGPGSLHLSLAEVQVFGNPRLAKECGVLFDLVDEQGNTNDVRSGLLIAHRQGADMASSGTVCDDFFSDQAATIICKSMGYQCASYWDHGSKWPRQQDYQIALDDVQCGSVDQPFSSCNYSTAHNCGHSEDVFLTCEASQSDCVASKQVVFHLVDDKGKNTNKSGLLIAGRAGGGGEVPGTVCDDDFSTITATVICKEMGYRCSHGWTRKQWDVQKQYPIVMDDVVCTNPNATFSNCTFKRTSNCGHNEDIFLNCDYMCVPPSYVFSLIDIETGADFTKAGSGLLIAAVNGSENSGGTVCDDGFTMETATVICKEMNFSCAQHFFNNRNGNNVIQATYDIVLDNVICNNVTKPFNNCTYASTHNCAHSEDIVLTCKHSAQECAAKDNYSFFLIDKSGDMSGKTTLSSGLLVANRTRENVVGTVCDDRFNDTAADIICREMGFKCAVTWFHDDDWEIQSNLSIVLDNVECGQESQSFSDCNYKLYHDCSHSEDVFLICQNVCRGPAFSFYLVDEAGHQTHSEEGLLIVHKMKSVEGAYGGTVCGNLFTDTAASVICRQMGFGTAIGWSKGSKWGIQKVYRPILNNITCSAATDNFTECAKSYDHECGHDQDIFLTCQKITKHMCSPGSDWNSLTSECTPCPRNSYKALHNDDPCVACPANQVSDAGSAACSSCGAGLYNMLEQRCICPAGQYFDYVDYCAPCPTNTYKSSLTKEPECQPCPDGSDSATGATACSCGSGFKWAADACVACHSGSFSAAGSTTCTKCPADGSSTEDRSACKCAPGAFWDTAMEHCAQCPAAFFSKDAGTLECSPCPPYTTSGKGASECVFCQEGEKWLEHRCEACPAGTYGNKIECIRVSGDGVLSAAVQSSGSVERWVVPGAVVGVLALICLLLVVVVLVLRAKLNRASRSYPEAVEGEFMEMSYEPVTTDLGTADNIQLLPVDD